MACKLQKMFDVRHWDLWFHFYQRVMHNSSLYMVGHHWCLYWRWWATTSNFLVLSGLRQRLWENQEKREEKAYYIIMHYRTFHAHHMWSLDFFKVHIIMHFVKSTVNQNLYLLNNFPLFYIHQNRFYNLILVCTFQT